MSRPALSTTRGLEILDLLAAFPARAFTLSEIARASKINLSSCHSVINALLDRGYLTHGAVSKSYVLGPALVAAGQAAANSQSLFTRAREAAEVLRRELDQPVLVSAAIGDEVLGIVSLPNRSGRRPDLQVGERIPLVPPAGAAFVAWAAAEEVDRWIARRPDCEGPVVQRWRQALAKIRKRGYLVSLKTPGAKDHATLMAEMTARREIHSYRDTLTKLMRSRTLLPVLTEAIAADDSYDVQLIAAPIFNERGESVCCLSLSGLDEPLRGNVLQHYADALVRACLRVMRADMALRG